jgi:uncharacterized membrane protein
MEVSVTIYDHICSVALAFGNVILISSTSCFSIMFTAMLSPIVLGEKFYWKIDGVTIGFITIGTIFAVT